MATTRRRDERVGFDLPIPVSVNCNHNDNARTHSTWSPLLQPLLLCYEKTDWITLNVLANNPLISPNRASITKTYATIIWQWWRRVLSRRQHWAAVMVAIKFVRTVDIVTVIDRCFSFALRQLIVMILSCLSSSTYRFVCYSWWLLPPRIWSLCSLSDLAGRRKVEPWLSLVWLTS